MLSCFSCVWLFVSLWTVAHQAPLSMGFSRQESTGVSCHGLLQGISLTQGWNPNLIMFPALAGGFFTTSATWEAHAMYVLPQKSFRHYGKQHPQKLDTEQPYDPAIPLLGYSQRKWWNQDLSEKPAPPKFFAVVFTVSKLWKQLKCLLVNKCMKKIYYIHTVECYLTIKKKEILPFSTMWMNPKSIC